jgi:hypothetical protein
LMLKTAKLSKLSLNQKHENTGNVHNEHVVFYSNPEVPPILSAQVIRLVVRFSVI